MPARKHREGAELRRWEAAKQRRRARMEQAAERVKQLSGHKLVTLAEVAALLGMTTTKSVREAEARARERGDAWPPRITITPRITGYKLADVEAFIDSRTRTSEGDG
jgi:predicted DNA-binding transcriptional regulator AlpA